MLWECEAQSTNWQVVIYRQIYHRKVVYNTSREIVYVSCIIRKDSWLEDIMLFEMCNDIVGGSISWRSVVRFSVCLALLGLAVWCALRIDSLMLIYILFWICSNQRSVLCVYQTSSFHHRCCTSEAKGWCSQHAAGLSTLQCMAGGSEWY